MERDNFDSEMHSVRSLSHSQRTEAAKDLDATVCYICYEVRDDLLVMSKTCGHRACARCIGMTVRHTSFNGGAFQIPCPFGDGVIDWSLVEQCATKQELTWLVTNMVNHALLDRGEKQYWCPLCETGFISDNLQKCPKFQCPNCKKRACYRCRVVLKWGKWHDCDKSDSSSEGVLGTNAVECPGCLAPTVRVEGCNHMTCPCGVHYCWLCGDVITGRVNQHYREECSLQSTPHPPPQDAGAAARDEENVRNTIDARRIRFYYILLVTGPITMPAIAIVVAFFYLPIFIYAAWRDAFEFPDTKGTWGDNVRKVGWMVWMVVSLLIVVPLSLVSVPIFFVFVLVWLLVTFYIVIPVSAYNHGGLTNALSRAIAFDEYFGDYF